MDNRNIIMNHYTSSPYKKDFNPDLNYQKIETKSDSCIDHLNIYVKFENNILKDAYFNGEACAIATSSCSILLKNCLNKTISEIVEYIKNFDNMVNGKDFNLEELKEAIVFKEIVKQGHRKTCAYLPYQGLKKLIDKR